MIIDRPYTIEESKKLWGDFKRWELTTRCGLGYRQLIRGRIESALGLGLGYTKPSKLRPFNEYLG